MKITETHNGEEFEVKIGERYGCQYQKQKGSNNMEREPYKRETYVCPKCNWTEQIRPNINIKCPVCGYLRKQVVEKTDNGILGQGGV